MAPEPGPSEVFAPGVLAGQVVLITGGGTGLGLGAGLELARCGANVVIAGRREEVLSSALRSLASVSRDGASPSMVVGDVRSASSARSIVSSVMERHGRLDTLVNNAGGQYFVPAEAIVAKGWRAVWRLNVDGIVWMSSAAVSLAMRPAGSGMVVNVTLSPHHGMPGMAHSGSARAAVEALTSAWASSWASFGVSVVALAAGHFGTEATLKYPEVVRAGAARSVPLGRLGLVEEHAWQVALLCSPLGRLLSGSVVTLDGARDNWFGPWPPVGMADEGGTVPTEARGS